MWRCHRMPARFSWVIILFLLFKANGELLGQSYPLISSLLLEEPGVPGRLAQPPGWSRASTDDDEGGR